MNKVKFLIGENIDNAPPIEAGQFIVEKDTSTLYIDFDEKRNIIAQPLKWNRWESPKTYENTLEITQDISNVAQLYILDQYSLTNYYDFRDNFIYQNSSEEILCLKQIKFYFAGNNPTILENSIINKITSDKSEYSICYESGTFTVSNGIETKNAKYRFYSASSLLAFWCNYV